MSKKDAVIIHIEDDGKKGGTFLKGGAKAEEYILTLVTSMQASPLIRAVVERAALIAQVAEKRGWDIVKNQEVFLDDKAEEMYKQLQAKHEK